MQSELSSRIIVTHRKRTQRRLSKLLREAGMDDESVAMVRFIIFEYHHTRPNLFLAQMKAMLKSSTKRVDKDLALMVMQDAWNYFPHRSLNGGCPADRLALLDDKVTALER